MTINVKWVDDGKTICLLQRDANWTWEEFDTANVQSNLMIKEVSHQVDLIVDGADRLPPGYPVKHFTLALRSKPDNLRLLIIVISNSFGRTIFNTLSGLNQTRTRSMRAVRTTEEAYALAKTWEATV